MNPITIAVGLAIACTPILADRLGFGGRAGLGTGELAGIAFGVLVAALGATRAGGRARVVVLRTLLVAVACGVSLVMVEIALALLEPAPARSFEPQGMMRADDALDYGLTPGWTGHFADALGEGEIRINSRGQRDDEPKPSAPGVVQLLLVGDSFLFGNRLDQTQTIDAWTEKLSGGAVDAYNAGVAGYSPPNVLGALRRADWFRGQRTFYVFCQNDLLAGEQALGNETVVNGWLVHTHKPDGSLYSRAELESRAARPWQPEPFSLRRTLRETFGLVHLRAALARLRQRDRRLTDVPLEAFTPESVAKATATTLEMRALAESRGQRFGVVVIPLLEEVEGGAYLQFTRDFVDGLRKAGVEVVEPFQSLAPGDYIVGDEHLTASGSEKVARAILAATGTATVPGEK